MFEPVPIAFARRQELFHTGVQAVEGVSARVARDRATLTADEADNRPATRATAGGTASGVVFIGQAPSLSTGVLGVFGELDETRQGAETTITRFAGLASEAEVGDVGPVPGPAEGTNTSPGALGGGGQSTESDDLTPEEAAELRRLQALDSSARQQAGRAGVGETVVMRYEIGPDGGLYAVDARVQSGLETAGLTEQGPQATPAGEGAATVPESTNPFALAAGAYSAANGLTQRFGILA